MRTLCTRMHPHQRAESITSNTASMHEQNRSSPTFQVLCSNSRSYIALKGRTFHSPTEGPRNELCAMWKTKQRRRHRPMDQLARLNWLRHRRCSAENVALPNTCGPSRSGDLEWVVSSSSSAASFQQCVGCEWSWCRMHAAHKKATFHGNPHLSEPPFIVEVGGSLYLLCFCSVWWEMCCTSFPTL